MNLFDYCTEAPSVMIDMDILSVFDLVRKSKTFSFLPVVDGGGRPVGVIRENDLKEYAYGRYGHELIKRLPLHSFIRKTLVLPVSVSRDELLASAASNPNPDGLVLTDNGRYRAVLLNNMIFRLFDENRLETQVRLIQAQKMEAIGTLAGGIAHDLNNTLTPILGYAGLLRRMHANGEPLDGDMIEQIQVCGVRARDTVARILTFSREQKTERHLIALPDTIKEVVRLLGNSIPSTIEITHQIRATNYMVHGNASELNQVLMNLCTNAYHAMKAKGGQLSIILDEHRGPLLGWSLHQPDMSSGAWLRLTVRDTGEGMPDNILPKICEPFFTTKKNGEGTGLGLAIVHGVVTRYKGALSVETALGAGTSVHIYLQAHASPTNTCREEYPVGNMGEIGTVACESSPAIRVYYVDDDYHITRLAKIILSRHGMEVVTENDSTKALAVLEQHTEDFDVLVTDQVMPSITGLELARRILNIVPNFPIIMCTGYSESVSPEATHEIGIKSLVYKPTDFVELAEIIRKKCRS